jgi:tripartite-type tricarboxylate transporter receptor subunit TctC
MMQNLTWDPIRDLSLVGMATMAPHVILVAPNVPANTLAEFIAHARANPGKLNYASSGNGSIQHIGGVLFARAIGTEMVHVPYRGAAPALQDVAGGRVEMFITTPSSAVALIQGGRVKALAMASARRAPGLPDVPTTAEAGLPGFTLDAWFAFAAPAATPRAVQERLNAAIRALAETAGHPPARRAGRREHRGHDAGRARRPGAAGGGRARRGDPRRRHHHRIAAPRASARSGWCGAAGIG